MSAGLEYDFKDAEAMLKALNPKAMEKGKMNVLKRGARILKKTVDAKYLFVKYRKPKKSKPEKLPMSKRGASVISVDETNQTVKVHIMGDYMMKWIELGTEMRYTSGNRFYQKMRKGKVVGYERRKIKKTGQISGRYLFRQAQNLTERRIFSDMKKNMEKEIIRQANKQRKKLLKQ